MTKRLDYTSKLTFKNRRVFNEKVNISFRSGFNMWLAVPNNLSQIIVVEIIFLIMSYGIYSVVRRQVFDFCTVRLLGSLYFEYVRMHVWFLLHGEQSTVLGFYILICFSHYFLISYLKPGLLKNIFLHSTEQMLPLKNDVLFYIKKYFTY